MTIPRNFPVGNVQLSKYLNQSLRSRSNPLSRLVPLVRPFSGPVPRWDGRAPLENVRAQIQAQEGGTMRRFLAARNNPTELKGHQPPQLSTQSLPPDVMTNPRVQPGSGTVRDAEPAKAASL